MRKAIITMRGIVLPLILFICLFSAYSFGQSNNQSSLFSFVPIEMSYCLQITKKNITDFAYSKDNTLYATAFACDGFYAINVKDGAYQTIPTANNEEKYQHYTTVLVTKQGKIWVGGKQSQNVSNIRAVRSSLLHLDVEQNKLIPYISDSFKAVSLSEKTIIGLYEDDKENLWIATKEGSLYELNTANQQLTAYPANKPKGNYGVLEIDEISKGAYNNLWVATTHGLYSFDLKNKSFNHFKSTEGFSITGVAEDKNGTLWIGTQRKKLWATNIKSPDILMPSTLLNSPTGKIDKLFVDSKDRLWVTTSQGIYLLNRDKKHFETFDERVGLKEQSLKQNGFFELPSGEIVVGQSDGYSRFNPNQLLQTSSAQKVTLGEFSFQINKIKAPLEVNHLEKLVLNHDENAFTLGFSAPNAPNPRNVSFNYRLKGNGLDISQKSTSTYHEHYTNFTNLSPGKYQFQVYQIGSPIATLRTLDIIIIQPWWNTWFAWGIYAILIVLTGYTLNHLMITQIRKKLDQKSLHAFNEELIEIFTKFNEEINPELNEFLGKISQIKKEPYKTEYAKRVALVKTGDTSFLKLTKQYKNLLEIRAKKPVLNLVKKETKGLFLYTYKNVFPIAKKKNIQLKYQISFKSLVMNQDTDKLATILSNLLINAIEFTPKNGIVFFQVKKQEQFLYIKVKDTGDGIAPEYINQIFEQDFNLDYYSQKFGVGVRFSQSNELVKLMGGKIALESGLEKGNTFKVWIPIIQNTPTVDGIFEKSVLKPERV